MKFTLDVDGANTLIKYAKAYIDPGNPHELYRMAKVEIDDELITATMITRVSAAVCKLQATNVSSDHGTMFIRIPLTLFKKNDGFVTIEDTEKETVYTTANGKMAFRKIDADCSSFLNVEKLFTGYPLVTVYVDGNLLARSVACMGKLVKVDILDPMKGIRLTSLDGGAIVLPINPNIARKELNK